MSGNPLLRAPRATDTIADDSDQVDTEEVRAIGVEVRRDLEEGDRPAINRHFEDLLDSMSSSASRAIDTGLPSRDEQQAAELMLRELCRAIDRGVGEALRGDGLRVRHVTAQDDAIVAVIEDRLGNGWQISCPFDALERDLERHGDGLGFVAAQVRRVVFAARQSRARWWSSGGRA